MPFFIVAVGAEKEESSGTSSVIAVQQRGVLLRSRGEEKVPCALLPQQHGKETAGARISRVLGDTTLQEKAS